MYVHAGDCWNAAKGSIGITREQARRALAEGVAPCPQCRPDTGLGVWSDPPRGAAVRLLPGPGEAQVGQLVGHPEEEGCAAH
ncbi:DUF6233 domain-containing protein [Streptomyces fumanus]|uniref:DUF6233 domain-containing protein n=1 Tax=Streptomyces fumanus TaxID=67302 RepID=UPI003400D71C